MNLLIVVIILFPIFVHAQKSCKEIENGFAFFDGKSSLWVESHKMKILNCDADLKLSLFDAKTGKELDTIVLKTPAKNEKWYFDGMGCNELNEKKGMFFRNKVVLSSIIDEGEALRPLEVWVVNRETKKLEKLTSKLSCHKDEP